MPTTQYTLSERLVGKTGSGCGVSQGLGTARPDSLGNLNNNNNSLLWFTPLQESTSWDVLSLPCSAPDASLLLKIVLFSHGLSLVWSAPYDGTAFYCTLQWCCSLPLTWYTPVRGYHCGGLLLAVIYTLQESPSWDVLSLPCCAPVFGLLMAFF